MSPEIQTPQFTGLDKQCLMEHPCIEFYRLDVSDPAQVGAFLFWLMEDGWPDDPLPSGEELENCKFTHEQLYEFMWWLAAPRKRMAKLLWMELQGYPDEKEFRRKFTIDYYLFTQDSQGCGSILTPIQQQFCKVLNAYMKRLEEDRKIGQGLWGEPWWLPPEEAEFINKQLLRVHPAIESKFSDYQDMLEFFKNGIDYPAERISSINAVLSMSDKELEPLKDLFRKPEGSAIHLKHEWRLAMKAAPSMTEWRQELVKLREHYQTEFEKVRPSAEVAEQKLQWIKNITPLPLLAQAIWLVPDNFEAALYADFIEILREGGPVLQCSCCNTPIGLPSNAQIARWRRGESIYHHQCLFEQRKEKKRLHWQRKAQDPKFKQEERERQRLYRKSA